MGQVETTTREATSSSRSTPRRDTEFGVFESLVGERFRVHWGPAVDEAMNLVLVEAALAPDAFQPGSSAAGRRSQCFSLLFLGDVSRRLEQRLYRVVHERVGDVALFLVPVGMDADGMYYESIFN